MHSALMALQAVGHIDKHRRADGDQHLGPHAGGALAVRPLQPDHANLQKWWILHLSRCPGKLDHCSSSAPVVDVDSPRMFRR